LSKATMISGADILGTSGALEQASEWRPVVCRDESDTRKCAALEVLREVYALGAGVYFQPNEIGNCHESAAGVLTMIARAGLAAPGWQFVQGDCRNESGPPFLHSWVEFDGWAVDFSNGRQFFAPAETFYKLTRAEVRRRLSPNVVAQMLTTRKGRRDLWRGR
jgi:hypothetical protein